jgi:hypothetical protein
VSVEAGEARGGVTARPIGSDDEPVPLRDLELADEGLLRSG